MTSRRLENRTLVLDLVEWIGDRPRPYADVMAAWQTSCPRLPIWEDALRLRHPAAPRRRRPDRPHHGLRTKLPGPRASPPISGSTGPLARSAIETCARGARSKRAHAERGRDVPRAECDQNVPARSEIKTCQRGARSRRASAERDRGDDDIPDPGPAPPPGGRSPELSTITEMTKPPDREALPS